MNNSYFQPGALHIVTGGAGFIGSHLAERLLAEGLRVIIADDFSLGTRQNIEVCAQHPAATIVEADVATTAGWQEITKALQTDGTQPLMIWHMAANSDIPAGIYDPDVDFRRTFLTTYETLRAAASLGVRFIAFASTSAVYGELDCVLDEKTGPLEPVSNYGAMKLASEATLTAATSTRLDRVWIFRFPNVVGPRATHGVIYDFFHKLRRTPLRLDVLGDGSQCKPYLHVSELVDAMWHITAHANEKVNCVLIGPEGEGATVHEIAERVVTEAGGNAQIVYGVGNRGWIGDVPRFKYSIEKLKRLGWQPKLTSSEAVARSVREIYQEIMFAGP
jgi:UDP-glucose 4-epimerase